MPTHETSAITIAQPTIHLDRPRREGEATRVAMTTQILRTTRRLTHDESRPRKITSTRLARAVPQRPERHHAVQIRQFRLPVKMPRSIAPAIPGPPREHV